MRHERAENFCVQLRWVYIQIEIESKKGNRAMVIDSFMYFIIKSLFFAIMLFVSTWVLIPKAVSYYLQWKGTGKSNFLSAASICFTAAVFFLVADLVMFVSEFIRRV